MTNEVFAQTFLPFLVHHHLFVCLLKGSEYYLCRQIMDRKNAAICLMSHNNEEKNTMKQGN